MNMASPIFGLSGRNIPTLPLKDAFDKIKHECTMRRLPYPEKKFEHLGISVSCANMFVEHNWKNKLKPKYGARGLTKEQAAFINFYTQESPFYPVINERLRDKERANLIPFFCWLKGFLNACYHLPLRPGNVKRGVKLNLRDDFEEGKKVVWWSITSTTANVKVLQNPDFLGTTGTRTLFDITASSLVDIADFSACPEAELILLPGTVLEVVGILAQGDLTIIQMRETSPFQALLDFVHPELTAGTPVPKASQPAPPS